MNENENMNVSIKCKHRSPYFQLKSIGSDICGWSQYVYEKRHSAAKGIQG